MLTDRQQKFYDRISSLSSNSSSATSAENRALRETTCYINKSGNFKAAINSMNQILQGFDKKVGLSPEVKALYEELISLYGEPDFKENGKQETNPFLKKDWRDSDPDLIYTGTGKVSGWYRRDGKGGFYWKALLAWAFLVANFLLFLLTPFLSWLRHQVGEIGFWALFSLYLLSLFVWLIRTGSLKRKTK